MRRLTLFVLAPAIAAPAATGMGAVARDGTTDLLVERYPQYRAMRPQGPVLAVSLAECRGWEASPAAR